MINTSDFLGAAIAKAGMRRTFSWGRIYYIKEGSTEIEGEYRVPRSVTIKPRVVFRLPESDGKYVYAIYIADDPVQLNSQIVRVTESCDSPDLSVKKIMKLPMAFDAHIYLNAAIKGWDWERVGSAKPEDLPDVNSLLFYEGSDVKLVDESIEHVDPLTNASIWHITDQDKEYIGIVTPEMMQTASDGTIVPPPYVTYRAIHGRWPVSLAEAEGFDRYADACK